MPTCNGDHVTAKPPSPSPGSKTRATIARLETLLTSSPAAEELASSWRHDKPISVGASPSSENERQVSLSDLSKILDTGRSLAWQQGGPHSTSQSRPRGVPMWVVVRACKAKWHHDGTWPLLGCDEALSADAKERLGDVQVTRSIHPSRSLLRPPAMDHFCLPPTPDEVLPVAKPDPSPDAISRAYRMRGIEMDEPIDLDNDDEF